MKGINRVALLLGTAAASIVSQQSAEGVGGEKHKAPKRVIGDSFFAQAHEGYPLEDSFALTSSFIYRDESAKSLEIGHFEMDLMWVWVLVAIVILALIVGIIVFFCCCRDSAPKKKEEMMEEKMDDMEKEGMMGEGMAEPMQPAEPAPM